MHTVGHTGKGSCICPEQPLLHGTVAVKQECTTIGHSSCVHSVAFSADGKRIVSGSGDNLVKIWNAETGAEVTFLECPLRPVS